MRPLVDVKHAVAIIIGAGGNRHLDAPGAARVLREASAALENTGYRRLEAWVVTALDQFLRERGRADERVAARLLELAPIPANGPAFASSTARIA